VIEEEARARADRLAELLDGLDENSPNVIAFREAWDDQQKMRYFDAVMQRKFMILMGHYPPLADLEPTWEPDTSHMQSQWDENNPKKEMP